MPILNYTTTVKAERTIQEIQTMLAKTGAQRIMIDYEQGEAAALFFQLHERPFRLPCRAEKVQEVLRRQRVAPRYTTTDHAQCRLAHRQRLAGRAVSTHSNPDGGR